MNEATPMNEESTPTPVESIPDGYALVCVAPSADQSVIDLYDGIIAVRADALAATVADHADVLHATEALSSIASLKRAMEAKRKQYLKPLHDYVAAINDAFKVLTEPLESADKTLRGKVLDYQRAAEERRREQERINRMKQDAAEAEAKLNGKEPAPVELVPVQPETPKRVETAAGTSGQRKVRKWRVTNFAEVPDQYKTIDNGRVTKAVKAGIGEIPGIEIYEETVLTVESQPARGVRTNGDDPF